MRARTAPTLALMALAVLATACGDGRELPADASPQARAAYEHCDGARPWDAKQDCYEALLLAELDSNGIRPSLDMLATLAAADRMVEAQAHVFTHAIGIKAYDPEIGFATVFSECTEAYQSGCYHGVVQAHFLHVGSTDAEILNELCRPYEEAGDRWILFQCLHGLGHGLTMLHGHHLPMALEGCDLLDDSWSRQSCYGGAFMENVVNAVHPHHPASEHATETGHGAAEDHGAHEPWEAIRADDPHYPCSVLDERYLVNCYVMQTSTMLHLNGGDYRDAGESCLDAPGREAEEEFAERLREFCFVSLGRDVSGRSVMDPDAGLRECGKTPAEYRKWCYTGLVKNFVNVTATTDEGFAFCERVEPGAKEQCYFAIGEEILNLHPEPADRFEACADLESEAATRACRRGARFVVPEAAEEAL